MLSIIVDAHEGRDVAVADVVGAYLNAKIKDFVVMKLTGAAVGIMCEVNSKYKEFVVHENGQPVLYVQHTRALYSCVTSALLWYELFATTLQEQGFTLNPYNLCVVNCIRNGKQCTVVWYVDDSKISHVDPAVVSEVIALIEAKFGKITVTCGRQHNFLGMEITLNVNRTATIRMPTYLDEAMADFGDDLGGPVATPATKELFEESDKAVLLPKEKQEKFHSIVAKLLYVAHQARPDLQPTIPYLCTRVSKSTMQDWEKLQRLLRYIKGSRDLGLTLGTENFLSLRTWVDASYAVHHDMKSHTGGAMSLGRGAFGCKSIKQKLNTKSSTEAKLVGISDFLPNTIWTQMFLEAQGHTLIRNVLAQDNKNAIQLARNGCASAGQKSRHIDIRYFFVKDRLKIENLTIELCPTLAMLADFFTKPLQGAFISKVACCHSRRRFYYKPVYPATSMTKERVEEQTRTEEQRTNEGAGLENSPTLVGNKPIPQRTGGAEKDSEKYPPSKLGRTWA